MAVHERKGKDYLVLSREKDSKFAIMAPHGGGIEPGTASVADAIAGDEYAFYAFKGIKRNGNRVLHISSSRFDEPQGVDTSKHALAVIAVHGCRDKRSVVFIGGKNKPLIANMIAALKKAGFEVENSQRSGLRGINPKNICNRCLGGEGVQLELSRGLRERMFDHLDHRSPRVKTDLFDRFITAVRDVLNTALR